MRPSAKSAEFGRGCETKFKQIINATVTYYLRDGPLYITVNRNQFDHTTLDDPADILPASHTSQDAARLQKEIDRDLLDYMSPDCRKRSAYVYYIACLHITERHRYKCLLRASTLEKVKDTLVLAISLELLHASTLQRITS